MAKVRFEDYKAEILKAIDQKLAVTNLGMIDPGGFVLIEGFINLPLQNELGEGVFIGGPTIPAVSIVGKTTGIMYTFALKALLPNLTF